MPKSHPPYPPEHRQHILELVRLGRTPEELAREVEPSAQCIRDWRAVGRMLLSLYDGLELQKALDPEVEVAPYVGAIKMLILSAARRT